MSGDAMKVNIATPCLQPKLVAACAKMSRVPGPHDPAKTTRRFGELPPLIEKLPFLLPNLREMTRWRSLFRSEVVKICGAKIGRKREAYCSI